MRTLLLSSFFYPHYGGSQRYMEELYANLVKVDSSMKVDVICYNTNHVEQQEKYRGLNIYRVPCIQILPGQFALPNYFSLIKLISRLTGKYHYDIVHSNTRFFEHSWWAPFLAKMIRAKSILTDHCANHPVSKSWLITLLSGAFDRISLMICARIYDLVTVTNKATLKFLKTFNFKSPQIVYGGVDTNYFSPAKKKQECIIPHIKHKFSKQEIIVSFVSRMIKSKGPDLLLEVAQKTIRQFPKTHFIFAGDGELFNHLVSKSNNQIHFIGALDSEGVVKLLSQTDIFIHPSIHHEGFPNVVLEAGSCGCAVIATDNGGTKEIVINNETGLLIKFTQDSLQNALEKLILDQRLRIKLSRAMRKKIELSFDWKIIVEQFQKLITSLVYLDLNLKEKALSVWSVRNPA